MSIDICFICCEPGADSRDHVIPRSFFVEPISRAFGNLVTLPAHKGCHDQLDEAYLRDVFAGMAGDSVTAWYLKDTKIKRSFRRDPDRLALILSNLSFSDRLSPGGVWLNPVDGLKLDKDRFYPPLRKIVRGLYFYHMKKLLRKNPDICWDVDQTQQEKWLVVRPKMKKGLTYASVFECWYYTWTEGNVETTVWLLQFYNEVVFIAVVKLDITENVLATSRNQGQELINSGKK